MKAHGRIRGIRNDRPLYLLGRPGTYCIEGMEVPRTTLGGCGVTRRRQEWIPAPSKT